MNLEKYNQIIEDLKISLSKNEITPEELENYLRNKFGIDSSEYKEFPFQSTENWQKEKDFERETFPIRENILNIIKHINEVINNPNPFTIKYNSYKLMRLFEEQSEFRKSENYQKAFDKTMDFIKEFRGDLTVTPEIIKMLKNTSQY